MKYQVNGRGGVAPIRYRPPPFADGTASGGGAPDGVARGQSTEGSEAHPPPKAEDGNSAKGGSVRKQPLDTYRWWGTPKAAPGHIPM